MFLVGLGLAGAQVVVGFRLAFLVGFLVDFFLWGMVVGRYKSRRVGFQSLRSRKIKSGE